MIVLIKHLMFSSLLKYLLKKYIQVFINVNNVLKFFEMETYCLIFNDTDWKGNFLNNYLKQLKK